MATEGNGGLGSSEEVREGQQIGRRPLERVAAFPMEDSTQNTFPWLEAHIRGLVREAFEHLVKSGPARVASFLMEDSTQNTSLWLESYIRRFVREAFEHLVKSGPPRVAAFLMEDSTQNTPPWLDSCIRRFVRYMVLLEVHEAFEHFMKSGPVMDDGRYAVVSLPGNINLGHLGMGGANTSSLQGNVNSGVGNACCGADCANQVCENRYWYQWNMGVDRGAGVIRREMADLHSKFEGLSAKGRED